MVRKGEMWSAICFSLDQSKIMSSGNELNFMDKLNLVTLHSHYGTLCAKSIESNLNPLKHCVGLSENWLMHGK